MSWFWALILAVSGNEVLAQALRSSLDRLDLQRAHATYEADASEMHIAVRVDAPNEELRQLAEGIALEWLGRTAWARAKVVDAGDPETNARALGAEWLLQVRVPDVEARLILVDRGLLEPPADLIVGVVGEEVGTPPRERMGTRLAAKLSDPPLALSTCELDAKRALFVLTRSHLLAFDLESTIEIRPRMPLLGLEPASKPSRDPWGSIVCANGLLDFGSSWLASGHRVDLQTWSRTPVTSDGVPMGRVRLGSGQMTVQAVDLDGTNRIRSIRVQDRRESLPMPVLGWAMDETRFVVADSASRLHTLDLAVSPPKAVPLSLVSGRGFGIVEGVPALVVTSSAAREPDQLRYVGFDGRSLGSPVSIPGSISTTVVTPASDGIRTFVGVRTGTVGAIYQIPGP